MDLLTAVSNTMTFPQVILLNGCSSAGKSSIAQALQAQLPGLWLHIKLDQFLQMLPLHLHGAHEGLHKTGSFGSRITA